MTTIALDPPGGDSASQAPKSGRSIRRGGARRSRPIDKGRILAVAGIGAAVIGGFAGAMTLLSGLAAPPPRPSIAINTRAAEWPDLRDGVPALARPEAVRSQAAADVSGGTVPLPAASPPGSSAVAAPGSLRAALDPATPAVLPSAPTKPAGTLPQIENAAMLAPLREAALVMQPRAASIVRPLASETVRARTAAASAFAALEPEDATASVAEPVRETATREPAKPRAKVSAVKPARPTTTAAPVAASAPAEPDSDDTEVLGMKIPSLASAGRKLRAAFGGAETASAATE